jgi:hypothetical protein
MRVNSCKHKADKSKNFYKLLFKHFLAELPEDFLAFSRVIPHHAARVILCSHRYTEEQVKYIVKKWAKLGLIEIVKFRGFKINGFKNDQRI